MLFWPQTSERQSLVDFAGFFFFAVLRVREGGWRRGCVGGWGWQEKLRDMVSEGRSRCGAIRQNCFQLCWSVRERLGSEDWRRRRPCNGATLEERTPHLSRPTSQSPSDTLSSASAGDVDGNSSEEGRRDGETDGWMSQVPRRRSEETRREGV